jgi:O-antigen/teichoic acid export membrane protein
MAYQGYAYWGLATQNIVFTLSVSVLNYWFSGWRPSLHIDLSPIRDILGFSSRLIVTNIVVAANTNYLSVLLGKFYTADEVGDFTQANKWNTMGHSLITNMLYSIAQPVLTKTQSEPERQKQVFRKLLRFTAFIAFPAMLCLSLISEEFIVILITAKWLSSAQMLRVLCVAGAVMPISYLFSNLLITSGRSSAYMWSTLGLCTVQLVVLGFCVPFGINRMVQAYAVVNILWLGVWFWLSHNEIRLSVSEAIKDISPYLILSVAIVIATWFVTRSVTNLYVCLILRVVMVAVTYCLALWVLRSTIFKEVILFITKKEIK